MNNKKIIGICGYATSGKDTFAKILKNEIEKTNKICYIFNFAEELKSVVNLITKKNFNIDCHQLSGDEKELFRPLLIGVGEGIRVIQPDYWIKTVEEKINKLPNKEQAFILIPDVRFNNECEWILQNNKNKIIFIESKINKKNNQELKNLPYIKENYCNFILKWPRINDDVKKILTNDKLKGIVKECLNKIF